MQILKYGKKAPEGNGKPVFIDGVRTPFVKSFGEYAQCDALELFSRVVDGILRKTGVDPQEIDEISAGVVVPQTKNANVARDAIINLGLPNHIHGYTINRACTSSMHTIADAAKAIRSGHPDLHLAGGVEVLSDVPIVYSKEARQFLTQLSRAKSTGDKLKAIKNFSAKAWIPHPPALAEPLTGLTMGESAEIMAKLNRISRSSQDELAVRSHMNAAQAQEAGKFDEELIPMWPSPRFQNAVLKDNMVRGDSNLEALAKLKPAFDRKYGSLTAGNSSPLTDGAAISLIADEKRALELGLKPKSRIVDFCFVGVDPKEQLLIGPAIAIPLLLNRLNMSLEDIDLFEIHEAFAAQVLSCIVSMESADFNERYFGVKKPFGTIPAEKLNVNGGAIAIGHPFGATGSRLVTTLSNELIRSNKKRGLIAICAAGGMAGAMVIERI